MDTSSSFSFFFVRQPPPPRSTLFPYTTLFRSALRLLGRPEDRDPLPGRVGDGDPADLGVQDEQVAQGVDGDGRRPGRDRKSTRLNSSHITSSYAVFCLKKKNRSTYISHVS